MATWKNFLEQEFKDNGEDFSKMITTLSEEELNREFDDGYGGPRGVPFLAWGDKFVYFPVCYDGSEWVGSVPRNPCEEPRGHFGGW